VTYANVIQVQVPVRAKRIGGNNNCLAITHRAAKKRLQPRFAARGVPPLKVETFLSEP
jgi:hypothetical protein